MEDSPNEVQNINNPTQIEDVEEPKTREELQKEIDLLKAENTKTKRNLMWKVRKLEKDKILTENEKIRLERELKSLRGEVERFRSPPLILATITEIIDDWVLELP